MSNAPAPDPLSTVVDAALENGSTGVEFTVERRAEGYVYDITGRVYVSVMDGLDIDLPLSDERRMTIGAIDAVWMPYVDSAETLMDEADAVSEDAYQLAHLPWLDDELKLRPDESMSTSWLGVTYVHLEPAWRGRRLSFLVMREIIEAFAAGPDAYISVRPHPPINPDSKPWPTAAELAEPIARLSAHWEAFGFRHVAGGIYGHGMQWIWPAGSWMASNCVEPSEGDFELETDPTDDD